MRFVTLMMVGLGIQVLCFASSPRLMPRLTTQWTETALEGEALPEYPRPGMVRSNWLSLNGNWNYKLTNVSGPSARSQSGTIRVPFPVESFLSGVQSPFNDTEKLEYRRTFSVPEAWLGQRVLLHFDAVNWEAQVKVNGKLIGTHRGGYDRFSYDITDSLALGGKQELIVSVKNPVDRGSQPRGKQSCSPHTIWYTASSGIWQTVWLEPVPAISIETLHLIPDIDRETLGILIQGRGDTNNLTIQAVAFDGLKEVARATGSIGQIFKVPVQNAKLWSPEHPFLYDLRLSLMQDGKAVDTVSSYFGMRKISVAKGSDGLPRILLNNHPYFQLGLLDQGYWPDGIYTAPTDEARKSDIELTRKLGFNMCRKHVKIEPERWYYWCDKLGLLVWQDMPSAGVFAFAKDNEANWPAAAAEQFQNELESMIRQNINHPSIVIWTAFNEGWGQHDTTQTITKIKKLDSTRLVIGASGWNDKGGGDVLSLHKYPGPPEPKFKDSRAVVCGECGGLGWTVTGHLWPQLPSWSYTHLKKQEELTGAYFELMDRINLARKAGLSGAVVTQLSDVEGEVNGMVTYDRKVLKVGSINGKFKAWDN